jgi:hypothetical protein
MKKGVMIGLIIGGVLILLIIGFFVLTNNKGEPKPVSNSQDENNVNKNQMVDCGMMNNPTCFANRMSECLPVTAELTATDGSPIEITILGVENETCHFQRKVNNVIDLNCYFPRGTMNWDTIDQTFGNDKGLQSVVDEACKSGAGW